VPAHGIGKARFKQVVVAGREPFQQVRQGGPVAWREIQQGAQRPARQDQGFERPQRPERHQGHPVVIVQHHPVAAPQFLLQVVLQQRATVAAQVLALPDQFPRGLVGDVLGGPDLAVRVRIGAAHHSPFILKHLHIMNALIGT